jgi:oxalate decarboxylase/phosphoglucose isomerase-like protein (cupin superfamily)
MALEEVIYVAEGQGLATVWAEGHPKVTFEWQKHSLFRIPTNYLYELSNTRGDQVALTLHNSYLPLAMATHPNPDFFFNSPYVDPSDLYGTDGGFYSADARAVRVEQERDGTPATSQQWIANFFPDLTLWDKLTAGGAETGRLAYSGNIRFPNSAFRPGLMVLPSRRYRAAHRHGPGVTIVGIQEAEGLVIMDPSDGGERLVVPWHEGSVFVPPNMWYHWHMNVGASQNRQLRMFPPRPAAYHRLKDRQPVIPYVDEDPWIRRKFEEEVGRRGLTSVMPAEAYTNPNYEWDEEWLKED